MDKDQIISALEGMTVLDLKSLVKELEERWGVSAAAPAAAAAAPAAGGAAAAAGEEQAEFSPALLEAGANKIQVIKAVRELTSLRLKEAEDVDARSPQAVTKGLSRD